jgi:hypothetical protein
MLGTPYLMSYHPAGHRDSASESSRCASRCQLVMRPPARYDREIASRHRMTGSLPRCPPHSRLVPDLPQAAAPCPYQACGMVPCSLEGIAGRFLRTLILAKDLVRSLPIRGTRL